MLGSRLNLEVRLVWSWDWARVRVADGGEIGFQVWVSVGAQVGIAIIRVEFGFLVYISQSSLE